MNCVQTPAQYNQHGNSLSTPEPHYIPGYLGYVPQAKYRPGHTYGMTSHRVLLDPCIHMSPRSMLTNIHPEHCTDDFGRPGLGADPLLSSKMALVNSRVNSFGRQQYQPNMTPGYTGYVPRFQTILGHTYSPACNRALARFEQDQWRDRLFNKELEALDGWRFCYKSKPWESPEINRPDNGDLQEFPRSPCQGGQQSLQRNAVVPRSSGCGCSGGGGGPTVTMGCGEEMSILTPGRPICDYGDRRMWGLATERLLNKPCGVNNVIRINPNAYCKPLTRIQEIYRGCEGMLPYYNGHVPGEQFRIGKTYGTATRNAKRAIVASVLSPLCMPLRKSGLGY